MWRDKKWQPIPPKNANLALAPSLKPKADNSMADYKPTPVSAVAPSQKQTILGPSMSLHGELSGNEDLLVEGQFEGTLKLPDHCVTVGSQGQVKAEVHARHVIVLGTVNGNIIAREKIEIRKSGRVVGDLAAAGIAIEDGAYLKGSIDIQRGETQTPGRSLATASAAVKTSV